MSDGEPIMFEESSGNIFEDIGFERVIADRLAHKADLVAVLYRYQQERDLNQISFSRLIGIPQPRLSKLYNGKIDGISTEKLLDAIARLGGHVTIRVQPPPYSKHCRPGERRTGLTPHVSGSVMVTAPKMSVTLMTFPTAPLSRRS